MFLIEILQTWNNYRVIMNEIDDYRSLLNMNSKNDEDIRGKII